MRAHHAPAATVQVASAPAEHLPNGWTLVKVSAGPMHLGCAAETGRPIVTLVFDVPEHWRCAHCGEYIAPNRWN